MPPPTKSYSESRPHYILPISLIATCYNERHNVARWCDSLLSMDGLPAQVVIADSDSTDGTADELLQRLGESEIELVIIRGKCNISEGRNRACARATFDKIAITDFGVVFHPFWISRIYAALLEHDWVGGHYDLISENMVQRSFCRLFDVSADKLNSDHFLPSSRSFGIRKQAFIDSGGYDTTLRLGEDTEFVLRLRKSKLRYCFAGDAKVYWLPRPTIRAIFYQNYGYAFWDAMASQNKRRWGHLLFLAFVFGPPLLSVGSKSWVAFVTATCLGMGLLYAKTLANTRRAASHSWPRPLDVAVYLTCLGGGVVGYCSGTWARARSSNAS